MRAATTPPFPVRIRIAVPDRGLGERFNQMHEGLDQNTGADGWAMTPRGRSPSGPLVGPAAMHGVLNDAISVHFADTTTASAFVARGAVPKRLRSLTACFGSAIRAAAPDESGSS
jgi:hypothetical protein